MHPAALPLQAHGAAAHESRYGNFDSQPGLAGTCRSKLGSDAS